MAIRYPERMLNGFKVYSVDPVWQKILSDLRADVADKADFTCVNIDNLNLKSPISALELKMIIINALDFSSIARNIVGPDFKLSYLHSQIIGLLYNTGGMSVQDLKSALGYAPNTTTHTVNTAICHLRKVFGQNFIINENGVYKIGKI